MRWLWVLYQPHNTIRLSPRLSAWLQPHSKSRGTRGFRSRDKDRPSSPTRPLAAQEIVERGWGERLNLFHLHKIRWTKICLESDILVWIRFKQNQLKEKNNRCCTYTCCSWFDPSCFCCCWSVNLWNPSAKSIKGKTQCTYFKRKQHLFTFVVFLLAFI